MDEIFPELMLGWVLSSLAGALVINQAAVKLYAMPGATYRKAVLACAISGGAMLCIIWLAGYVSLGDRLPFGEKLVLLATQIPALLVFRTVYRTTWDRVLYFWVLFGLVLALVVFFTSLLVFARHWNEGPWP